MSREDSLSISSVKTVTEYPRLPGKRGKFPWHIGSPEEVINPVQPSEYQGASPLVQGCRNLFLFEDKTVPSKFEQKSEDISIKDIRNSLKTISDINDLINFGKGVFPKSEQYLFELATEAIEDFYPEEEGDEISVESLKGMLLFLYSLKRFKEPEISISETGVFYVDWEEEVNNSLTVRFKDDFFLEYSLFQPSVHTDKWNIRNGKVHILDFKDDLLKLDIKLHREI